MIRPAVPSDFQRLQALWLRTLVDAHPSIPQQVWQGKLSNFGHCLQTADLCLVYTANGKQTAEGFALITGTDQLEYLCVSPAFTKRGAGSELMRCAKRGRPQLLMTVLEENLNGRYFLQQQDFKETGRQPCAVSGQAEILMRYRPKLKAA
ncbi:GNAT family protein [Microbulbifer thermotolerans]|nr:GNAT family N-acetyltransferase [Microbulbifer thermotolerans]MCX2778507.1 GNAT family N-acetyltransferase [Microbulbifer thermotolerans]MCX2782939.1 GNAT family N-acetyltransferase [Microbulbifer thermotolerans]MCX2801695.1 GNAT family N-acetyltransferase [Microbulbifer thermotolerans]MCX2803984.1 GNAT family N-acetyltransferase [Microbulbifer thermotolerans]MCX2833417.1 GNAT family N-acetyltransferase [Microbulbifer thermotolerans]